MADDLLAEALVDEDELLAVLEALALAVSEALPSPLNENWTL